MPEELIHWDKLIPEERDRLIAIKIMGWDPNQKCEGPWIPMSPEPDGMYCPECGATRGWGNGPWYHAVPYAPSYTESMDAAMQVLEHERFMHVTIEYDRSWRDETTLVKTYSVVIFPYDMHGGVGVTANMLPHAICIAALKAVGCTFAEDKE